MYWTRIKIVILYQKKSKYKHTHTHKYTWNNNHNTLKWVKNKTYYNGFDCKYVRDIHTCASTNYNYALIAPQYYGAWKDVKKRHRTSYTYYTIRAAMCMTNCTIICACMLSMKAFVVVFSSIYPSIIIIIRMHFLGPNGKSLDFFSSFKFWFWK